MKIYWDSFRHWIAPICVLLALSVFLIFGVPGFEQQKREEITKHTVISDITYSFIDSVALVQYNYGFWGGLGGITSTTVTFARGVNVTLGIYRIVENISAFNVPFVQNGTAYVRVLENQTVRDFTFNGNLAIASGKFYNVQYEIITHADNETNFIPLSLSQI